ncbi:elongation factor G [Clostridium gasigenes]|uniref:TetM/TetW/TetO/TetS family tetracycline resistance ribosomal protection protein n=1 Tax=Clostridium gasigenes TaxID=94869 RepID=A0A7X0VQQ2_9CLOT|nr:TetM/TetW/TetO/TetS family tetracycline resistance ribosomal protection protein [Clostridium gasigenes]MBB6713820.1 TetM/TetW/TetO/TetS family tetracycline resistance ribosomal protection protein [Clostridium gasigenes]
MFKDNIRNIGIVAHVDAGKTTVTEQLLYKSGSSRTLGSVDKGTTHTDSMDIEKQRGISVKSSEIDFKYKDTHIYLIDTPGHIDFIGEVERSLGILDGSVVVISSVESVQPQTEIYFNTLKEMNTPTIFFINKLDRIGSDPKNVLNDIKKLLTSRFLPLQIIEILDNGFNRKDLFSTISSINDVNYSSIIEDIVVLLGEENESILNEFYDETLTLDKVKSEIIIQAKAAKIYPVLFGIAIDGVGIEELLDGLIDYIPAPINLDNEDFSALVYKISHHKTFGKISHIKIFSGKLKARENVLNIRTDIKEKVTLMRKIINHKDCDIKEGSSGELIMISGLNSNIGDILGIKDFIPKLPNIANPVLTLKVYTKIASDYIPLVEALTILQSEDPLLNMEWIKDKSEINIQITGAIQIEIIQTILKERFNLEASFSEASVIYRETPSIKGYCEEYYTMPKPCWAVVTFLIEPLPLGSGIIFESEVRTEYIKQRYRREIESNLDRLLKQGLYGWNVTDLKITLVDGEDHVIHSRSGDFTTATAIALMRGFSQLGMTLLEPLIDFKISVPEMFSSKVLNDIVTMRGAFDSPTIINGIFTVVGSVPVSTSLNYPINLGILSSGRGVMSTKFSGYAPCPIELGSSKEFVGVNPTNRSKYILYARKAL